MRPALLDDLLPARTRPTSRHRPRQRGRPHRRPPGAREPGAHPGGAPPDPGRGRGGHAQDLADAPGSAVPPAFRNPWSWLVADPARGLSARMSRHSVSTNEEAARRCLNHEAETAKHGHRHERAGIRQTRRRTMCSGSPACREDRACCCPAQPVVRVIMPPGPEGAAVSGPAAVRPPLPRLPPGPPGRAGPRRASARQSRRRGGGTVRKRAPRSCRSHDGPTTRPRMTIR